MHLHGFKLSCSDLYKHSYIHVLHNDGQFGGLVHIYWHQTSLDAEALPFIVKDKATVEHFQVSHLLILCEDRVKFFQEDPRVLNKQPGTAHTPVLGNLYNPAIFII